ncbi:MAG: hemerythrin domain-containing protein [Candidatus Accumulibacter sp.]|uniref:hemerythrin domain-containing protein n=1 Tax=Accumulibacter sp. TaxID=2053492 RepID=UPI0025CF0F35|nr:hemerythrin domain-containing protein [Accumulibacter sp.]MCM8598921.1 hemerythrin domain-containing protein [Accumulibacter sp.]
MEKGGAMSETSIRRAAEAAAPLQDFSTCHIGFVTLLEDSLGLPEMVVTAARARGCAADVLKMFRDRLLVHHDDEERDLFPAVLQVAASGEEAERAQAMVTQLIREHREIAQLWKKLEPAVQAIANGDLPQLDSALLQEMVRRFNEHVRMEEVEFLPFAQLVLARQAEDMAALGLALHRRHEADEIMATAVVYGAS